MQRTTHHRSAAVLVLMCCIIAASVASGVDNPWVMIVEGCALVAVSVWFGMPLWRRDKRMLIVSIVVALVSTAGTVAVLMI